MTDDGALTETVTVQGKQDLVERLREWLDESSSKVLGADNRAYRGWPAIKGDIGGHQFRLNADTTRVAIQGAVTELSDPLVGWAVIRTQRGRASLVLPGSSRRAIPGWYCYLIRALDKPGEI